MVVPCSPRFSLISAWLGLANGLNDPVVRKVWFADPRGVVPRIDPMLVFRPYLGLVHRHRAWLLGSITSRTFRLCGENPRSW